MPVWSDQKATELLLPLARTAKENKVTSRTRGTAIMLSLSAISAVLFYWVAFGQEGRPQRSIPDPTPANEALQAAQTDGTAIDITNFHASSQSADCADYAGAYTASVMNLGGGPLAILEDPAATLVSAVVITGGEESCTLISDNIPSHDFNDDTAGFRDPVNEVGRNFNIPRNPVFADSPTFIGQQAYNGVMLNGVPLD